ncbi:hypothetical protein KC19_4G242800 [Ceratodon purpureus]|uniref:PGG domain-containing protein n=1 Tax=Ceratodon purpureus TaxID=3225 RepID=A0A8T0IE94_CERPU|nr:hypothetical protein KC19_4G242800 [Ceratodon purpureus]KAG0581326.1 hypothetical protein KC19_4G242800 [Ceratodon purpureus]KAG0581327.1 hypothetical protein KC19_4G242800 [Ceratodon purpureus]KAG0581328.1 hypothetical protein KC19_4G242800 [Ceratodon purpureus]KAG0581329.1 hypothetical protein KC19_4G242800 [Ceratodon purpureus]
MAAEAMSSMAAETKAAEAMFENNAAMSSSEWVSNLERYGSCLRLLELLEQRLELIHQVGPEGITVLHKGVDHGCVQLVKFILVDMFDDYGHCKCSRHRVHNPQEHVGTSSAGAIAKAKGKRVEVEDEEVADEEAATCALTRKLLLRKASDYGSTAVNMAVVSGSPKMVLLLKWAIDKCSPNRWEMAERTPLAKTYTYDDYRIMKSAFERERENPTVEVPTVIAHNDTEVPAVADDGKHNIDKYIYHLRERIPNPDVYALVARILEEDWGADQEKIDILKRGCGKHADFEFVTEPSNVFLHYLFTFRDEFISEFQKEFLSRVLQACRACDETGSMVKSVFNILDPRGRTILHAAFRPDKPMNLGIIWSVLKAQDMLSSEVIKECMNARDGAGRTILHLMAILDHVNLEGNEYSEHWDDLQKNLEWTATAIPLCSEELEALKYWCFLLPYDTLNSKDTPILLAIIFNSIQFFESDFCKKHWFLLQITVLHFDENLWSREFRPFQMFRPFQIAAFLGRSKIIDRILQSIEQIDYIPDIGLGNTWRFLEREETLVEGTALLSRGKLVVWRNPCLPAIHCAALSSQVETIQTILKYPIYDPLIEDVKPPKWTALHLLLKQESFKMEFDTFHTLALSHALPNSKSYIHVKNDFLNLQIDDIVPRTFSANEISCINLLLQAGIDIWTRTGESKERPSPGPTANDEARKWWFERVATEVLAQKASVSNAANATSVVAALVATASFLGPFTPPLSYSNTDGGTYIHTSVCAVRVFMVCNSFSFFFSIASILMAVLPAIPMPKESLYDELFRSQRCLKFAALLLLIAILCLLAAFSSASIAVVSSEVHDKLVVVPCILLGGIICILVLVIYIIRMLRMLFHKNDRFRRWFAKNMKF